MDELEHVPRTPADRREEQFSRLRDRIEACASRKFEARSSKALPPRHHRARIDFRPEGRRRAGAVTKVTINRSADR